MKIQPAGYRVLVAMDSIEEVSKGGIVLARDSRERDQSTVETGTVVALGPQAFKELGDGTPWCEPGDKVRIRRYSGANDADLYKETGIMYRIVNDDDILATIEE